MSNDIRNPHQFRLLSDKLEAIPDSPLIRVGLAICSDQHYIAAVDPITKKNYVINANICSHGPSFKTSYSEISDDKEHNAISDFFLKVGVFERYWKGANWMWKRQDGIDDIPPWFKGRILNA